MGSKWETKQHANFNFVCNCRIQPAYQNEGEAASGGSYLHVGQFCKSGLLQNILIKKL